MFAIMLILVLIPKPILIVLGLAIGGIVIFIFYKIVTEEDSQQAATAALAHYSAKKGKVEAMHQLATFCLKGEGVEQDYGEAASWFRKAADKGYGPAARSLAMIHRKGLGVESNIDLATYWYHRAQSMGESGAQDELAEMLIEARRRSQDEARQSEERAHHEGQQRRSTQDGGGMERSMALEILDLKEGASREQIEAAYKRMMMKNHPDMGGSNFFAKQLNAAKDVLLGKK